MGHPAATEALLVAEQVGEEVAVEWRAWPWARRCCHRRVTAISVRAMAEQGLVPVS